MMMLRYLLVLSLLLLMVFPTFSQQTRSLKESQQMMQMDEGVEYMNNGQFALADDTFKEVLKNVEVVPADLCFYFGKNSYHLENFSQSIDWLNKYIELKGTSGRFFDQAVEYLQLAETEFKGSDNNRVSELRSNRQQNKLDCDQYPFVVCPVCKGEGVIIQNGALGSSVYKPCQYCDESGKMKCDNYKLYLRGAFNP